MTRAERHREIKQIKKELEYILKHTSFKALLKDKELNDAVKANPDAFGKGEYEDKALQEKYNKITTLFQRELVLEERLQYLRAGYKAEKDVPAIE